MVAYAVVLLLASVPVALPAAFALAGALGAQHLAGLGILTARITAVQSAASIDVLCVDKTGTITQNRLTLTRVLAREPATRADVLDWAAAASDAATQDPIDLAALEAAPEQPRAALPRLRFTPFDPATKRSEAQLARGTETMTVAKGAPQVIAQLCGQPTDPGSRTSPPPGHASWPSPYARATNRGEQRDYWRSPTVPDRKLPTLCGSSTSSASRW